MSGNAIYAPDYIQVVRRDEKVWHFLQPSQIIYSPSPLDSDFFTVREKQYGLTKAKMALEFRLIAGGTPGLYLADMKHKKYFYCGESWNDVHAKLLELGIGRSHPMGY